MTVWLAAAPGHQRYLNEFVCTEPVTEHNHYGKPVIRDPWNHTVQKLVRAIRIGTIREPLRVDLVFNASEQRIDAVLCYSVRWLDPTVLRVEVHVIAAHAACQGTGLGNELLRRVETVASAEASERPEVEFVLLDAQVHVSNERYKALIMKRGWATTGPADDPNNELWASSLDLPFVGAKDLEEPADAETPASEEPKAPRPTPGVGA